jgi:hypothetical protein
VTRIALTISANNVPGKCAVWSATDDGELPVMGGRSNCSPQTHAAFEKPLISEDDRTIAVAFRNWSDGEMRTPYLRVYYKKSQK